MPPLPPVFAEMRRLSYLAALVGCALWYLTFGQWLAWVVLVGLLALPLLSLALSIPAMLDFRLAPVGQERMNLGEKGSFLLMGACGRPMPPFRGKIRLRNLRTGEKIRYQEEKGFTPRHCGGFQVTVERGRVQDYLGLFSFPVRHRQGARLWVKPLPVADVALPEGLTQIPVCWKPSPNRLGENYELRPYRPGDSLNIVHWKLSAKTGNLTVRETMEPLHQEVCLTLSLFGQPEELDVTLGRLLWVGEQLLQAQMALTILASTGEGTARFSVADRDALSAAVEELMCLPAPEHGALPEPEGCAWHLCLGGEPV